MFENLNEELKEMLKDEVYEYFLIAFDHLINEISLNNIFPPFDDEEEYYNNELKKNFIELKERFKEIRYILYMLKYHFKTKYIYEIQYPLNIMDEMELNIIDKILSDGLLKSDSLLFDAILYIKKLNYFLKEYQNLENIDFLNAIEGFDIEGFDIEGFDIEGFDIYQL